MKEKRFKFGIEMELGDEDVIVSVNRRNIVRCIIKFIFFLVREIWSFFVFLVMKLIF